MYSVKITAWLGRGVSLFAPRSARANGASGNARNSNKLRVKRAKAVLSPVSFRYDLHTNIFPIFRPKPCHASLLSLQIYLRYLRRKAPRLARFGLEISRKLLARKSYSKTRKILKRKTIPLSSRFARHFPPRGKWPEGAIGGNHFFISHSFFFLAKERMGEERKRRSSDASLCWRSACGGKYGRLFHNAACPVKTVGCGRPKGRPCSKTKWRAFSA